MAREYTADPSEFEDVLDPAEEMASQWSKRPSQEKSKMPWGFSRHQFYTIALTAATFICVGLGGFMISAPQVRLLESVVCLRYYESHDPSLIVGGNVPEMYCKVDDVQEEIALLNGWQMLFDNVPGILAAIPYGFLADKYGRKWILFLGLLGICLGQAWFMLVCYFMLPIKLMWLSSLFLFLGGGVEMVGALALMIVADVISEEQRATIFFQLQAISLVPEVVGPPIGSLLMMKDIWTPLLLGFAITLVSTFIVLAIPKTSNSKSGNSRTSAADTPSPRKEERSTFKSDLKAKAPFAQICDGLVFMSKNLTISLLVFTFLVSGVARMSMEILLQYASKRYDWSLAKAGLLRSFRSFFNLVLLLFILPIVSIAIQKALKLRPSAKDLYLAQASSVLETLGFFVLAVSPTPALMMLALIINALGIGFRSAVRSLVTSMVEPTNLTSLYTAIAIMDTIGGIIAGPLLALTFNAGLKLGGQWIGLPFLIVSVFFLGVGCVIFMVQLPEWMGETARGKGHDAGEAREGEEERLL